MEKCESAGTSMNDFSGIGEIVGRFCETPTERRLTQTPYNNFSARKSSRRSWKIAFQAVSADRHLACRINDRQARSPPVESGRMPNFHRAQRGVPPLQQIQRPQIVM